MLKHIFTIIWNQRRNNAWLIIELFIISVSFWFIIDYTGVMLHMKHTPTGFDITHTYRIYMQERTPESEGYIVPEEKTTLTGEDILAVAEQIRRHPDIEAVSLSFNAQPYGNAFSRAQRELTFNESVHVLAQEYQVSPGYFDVFRVHPQNGGKDGEENSGKNNLKSALTPSSVIITPDLAKELSPTASVSGEQVTLGENGHSKRIAAISTPMRHTEYALSNPAYFTLLSDAQIADGLTSDNLNDLEICIRVKPEADKDFSRKFVEDMGHRLRIGNLFLIDVRSSYAARQRIVQGEMSQFFINTLLLCFLGLNIFLGIFGTFSFRTQQRRNEMGLRIATGSSRKALLVLVIAEGLLLLALATIPALFIDMNMGVAELLNVYWIGFTPLRFLYGTLFTFLALALMIVTGIWIPAWRTMKTQPTEALRSE